MHDRAEVADCATSTPHSHQPPPCAGKPPATPAVSPRPAFSRATPETPSLAGHAGTSAYSYTPPAEKTSWWGCGTHVASVMDAVPAAERCTCAPAIERAGKTYPPMGKQPS
ncbi:Uncharacterized protein TCAP_05247 [Tolypocladium capitatum]|uniref:Uncharacterized protein n=1 Tax=Tolypocladium capitatum TaxID=45235 RepID=A0A2K3QB94_9HYPO|nr:Uncharacterized protein TCAP_05247 [Tolypocladium capitatum]